MRGRHRAGVRRVMLTLGEDGRVERWHHLGQWPWRWRARELIPDVSGGGVNRTCLRTRVHCEGKGGTGDGARILVRHLVLSTDRGKTRRRVREVRGLFGLFSFLCPGFFSCSIRETSRCRRGRERDFEGLLPARCCSGIYTPPCP